MLHVRSAAIYSLYYYYHYVQHIIQASRYIIIVIHVVINPRCTCAARITVVVLFRPSVFPSVCLFPRFLPLRATRRPITDTNGFSATLALFLK